MGLNVDIEHWKTMHHVGHHPNTNVLGKDHDLGYSIMRGMDGQDWFGHHIAAGSKFLPTLIGNYLGGVAGYAAVLFLVLIEHHAGELETFTDPGPDETPDQYYERQFRATRNFLRAPQLDAYLERVLVEEVPFANRPDFRIFYGGLDTHIEHHMFPDLPPTKQREVGSAVRAIAARRGMPYHETALLDTVPMIAKALTRLSLPLGQQEIGRPLRLLAHPVSLLRRVAFGLGYRTLPELPYLNRSGFYNVRTKVMSSTPVERGQARSIRLRMPRGWESVRWDAGAFVSVRVEVGGEVLVRQYSLVHDSDSSTGMEICVKRVAGGRVSNQLNDELRAGDYVTLVGAPTRSAGLSMDAVPNRSLFIAGGVGITPIISLLRRIVRNAPHSDAVLLYFNRDDRSIIFEKEIRELATASGVRVHLFTDEPSQRGDIAPERLSRQLIRRSVADAAARETYVCAPPAMIELAREWLSDLGLPDERFHAESFTRPALERPVDDGRRYTVRFRRSGRSVEIDGATTLLEAAAGAGIRVPTGCERGLCRACVTPKLAGTTRAEVDGARLDRITVCTSTACSDIELDL